MDKSITLLAFISAKNGMEDALREALQEVVVCTTQEQGCVEFRLMQDKENAAEFILVEKWIDEDSWKNHMEQEHVKKFLSEMDQLVEEFKGRSFVEIKDPCAT